MPVIDQAVAPRPPATGDRVTVRLPGSSLDGLEAEVIDMSGPEVDRVAWLRFASGIELGVPAGCVEMKGGGECPPMTT